MIGFVPYRFYRHKNMTCCCMWVLKSFYIKETQTWAIKIEWHRLYRDGRIRNMGFTQKFKIKNLDGWEKVDDRGINRHVTHG